MTQAGNHRMAELLRRGATNFSGELKGTHCGGANAVDMGLNCYPRYFHRRTTLGFGDTSAPVGRILSNSPAESAGVAAVRKKRRATDSVAEHFPCFVRTPDFVAVLQRAVAGAGLALAFAVDDEKVGFGGSAGVRH